MFGAFMKLVSRVGLKRAKDIAHLRLKLSPSQINTYSIVAKERASRGLLNPSFRHRKGKPAKSFGQRKAARVAKPTTKQARENYNRRMQVKARRDEMLGETGVPMYGHWKLMRDQAKRKATRAGAKQLRPREGSPAISFPEWMANKKTFLERKLARIKNAEKAQMLGSERSNRQRMAEVAGMVNPFKRFKRGEF